jgi:hypothetical protein
MAKQKERSKSRQEGIKFLASRERGERFETDWRVLVEWEEKAIERSLGLLFKWRDRAMLVLMIS